MPRRQEKEGWREWCSSSEIVKENVVVRRKNYFMVAVVVVAGFVALAVAMRGRLDGIQKDGSDWMMDPAEVAGWRS